MSSCWGGTRFWLYPDKANAARRNILALAEDNARQQVATDHMNEWIERIKTRLILSEA